MGKPKKGFIQVLFIPQIWIIILILIGLFFIGKYTGLLGIGFDDYDYYDKELQTGSLTYIVKNSPQNNVWGGCGANYGTTLSKSETDKWMFFGEGQCATTQETVENGKLKITASSLKSTIRTKKLVKGNDFKTQISYGLSSGADMSILVNGINLYSDSAPPNSATSSGIDMEMYYSVLEDKAEIKITGKGPIIVDLSGYDKIYFDFVVNAMVGQSGSLELGNIKYKVPYSCAIDDYSVLVFDDFTTSFSQSDLSYSPLRYCLNNPPIIRSFEDGGLMQDERGEIFQKLVTGQTVNVDDGKTIRVPYITKYVEGQTLRCELNEAWNTNTQQCERIVEQETPTEVIIACKTASDCWLPKNCEEITADCISNLCAYSDDMCQGIEIEKVVVVEKLVYQEVIKEIESETILPIYIGEGEFTYTFDKNRRFLYIGDYKIETNTPDFICGSEVDKRKDDCYLFRIGDVTTKYGSKFTINSYLNGICYAGGRVRDNLEYENDNWVTLCKFTMSDFMAIGLAENEKEFILNSNAVFNFKTKSAMYNFDNAGVFLDCERVTGVQKGLAVIKREIQIKTVETTQGIKLDTSEVGRVDCELTQFVRVNADKQFVFKDDNKLKFSYAVDTEIGELPNDDVVPEPCGLLCKIIRWFKSVFNF